MGEVVEFKKQWSGHQTAEFTPGNIADLDAGIDAWVQGLEDCDAGDVLALVLEARGSIVLGVCEVVERPTGQRLVRVRLLGEEVAK